MTVAPGGLRLRRDACENRTVRLSVAGSLVVAGVLREAAQAEVLPRFRDLAARGVRNKSSHLDLVTDADVAAEAHIARRLAAAFPHAVIVGEESASGNPALLDGLDAAGLALIVDPIDGTKNFASGLPLFGIMVGVLQRGTIVAGVIHDPIVDDPAFTTFIRRGRAG